MEPNESINKPASETPFVSDTLVFNLEKRKELIAKHKRELKYICRQVEQYIIDVEHILMNRMPISMISNLTYNLDHNLLSCYVGMTCYNYLQTDYLLDENYDANYASWKVFSRWARNIEKLITNLTNENVFNLDEPSRSEDLRPSEGVPQRVPISLLNLQHMLSKINGGTLFVSLLENIRNIESRLKTIKLGINYLNDEDFETIYKANYALYVETYWPSEGQNFRQHIKDNYFDGRESEIDTLSKLLIKEKYDFENTKIGTLWRDYFHNKKRLYFEMRKAKFDEEKWKAFFNRICRFEEYEKWIEELRNPQILQACESSSKSSGMGSANDISDKIIGFFTDGILKVDEPSLLYFLLLAMWARRLLENKEITSFVRMVGDAYPSLFNTERTQERVIMSLQNMNNKANKYFGDFVKDQATMMEYIESMYPKTKKGERRKDCERAIIIATKLFLKLK